MRRQDHLIGGFIQLALIAALAGAASAALATWKVTSWYYVARQLEAEQEAETSARASAQQANAASAELEILREALAAKTAATNRRIEHAINENRSWADQPLPVGVRDALAAARAAAAAGEPDGAVPPIPVERDQRQR